MEGESTEHGDSDANCKRYGRNFFRYGLFSYSGVVIHTRLVWKELPGDYSFTIHGFLMHVRPSLNLAILCFFFTKQINVIRDRLDFGSRSAMPLILSENRLCMWCQNGAFNATIYAITHTYIFSSWRQLHQSSVHELDLHTVNARCAVVFASIISNYLNKTRLWLASQKLLWNSS